MCRFAPIVVVVVVVVVVACWPRFPCLVSGDLDPIVSHRPRDFVSFLLSPFTFTEETRFSFRSGGTVLFLSLSFASLHRLHRFNLDPPNPPRILDSFPLALYVAKSPLSGKTASFDLHVLWPISSGFSFLPSHSRFASPGSFDASDSRRRPAKKKKRHGPTLSLEREREVRGRRRAA